MPTVPANNVLPFPEAQPSRRPVDQTFLMMAASDLHDAGQLFEPPGRPLDITSQAQKAYMQTKSNTWPEGTSKEVRKTFDDALKSGDITKDQYLKAMRDPRQFQSDQ